MTTSTPSINYRIIRITTTSPHSTNLIEKFRKTKLAALLADPASFSASHSDESLLPREVWAQRLAPPFNVFVCVAGGHETNLEDDETTLLDGDWVGMITLRGPLSPDLYRLSSPSYPTPSPLDPETRWHLSNLWISNTHRGRGLAKKMVQTCIDFATTQSAQLGKEKARVRLIIKDEGSFLKHMYAGMGFRESGRASLREAYVASGDEGSVPRDTSSSEELVRVWETRFGVVMERVVGGV